MEFWNENVLTDFIPEKTYKEKGQLIQKGRFVKKLWNDDRITHYITFTGYRTINEDYNTPNEEVKYFVKKAICPLFKAEKLTGQKWFITEKVKSGYWKLNLRQTKEEGEWQ